MSNPRYILEPDASETDRALYVVNGLGVVVNDAYDQYRRVSWAEDAAAEACTADHHDAAGERIDVGRECRAAGPAGELHRLAQSAVIGARALSDKLKDLQHIYATGKAYGPDTIHTPRHRAAGEWAGVRAELGTEGRPDSAMWEALTPARAGLLAAADAVMTSRPPDPDDGARFYGAGDAPAEPDAGTAPGLSVHGTKRADAIRPLG